jgi:N-acetylglucosaminyl-diphospho-decaprenol L-rhamnosyltransferase
MSRIGVVIVAYRSDADLARCLPTLEGVADAEAVVVDNSSQESTRTLIAESFPSVRYLDGKVNRGFACANNLGAAACDAEYLVFLNPDTEVDAGALDELADFLDAHPSAGAAGPFVLNPDGSRQMSCRRWPGFLTPLFHRYSLLTRLWSGNPWSRQYLMSDDGGMDARRVDWLSACCMMVRREAFESVDGFDERYFMFCEDTAFCKSLEIKGWERWYLPHARVTHHIGKSVSERSVRLVWQRHRSMWLYFRSFDSRQWLAPLVLLALAARASLYSIKALLSR